MALQPFSDSAEPEEVIALLRSYHAEMGNLIFNFGGTVEHFVADGLMVFFNDPYPAQDHTERGRAFDAWECAIE